MPLRYNASRAGRLPHTALRSRVTTAFRVMARGVDPATAFARCKAFYRSGGGEWARALA